MRCAVVKITLELRLLKIFSSITDFKHKGLEENFAVIWNLIEIKDFFD